LKAVKHCGILKKSALRNHHVHHGPANEDAGDDAYYTDESRVIAGAIVPKFAAALSLFGSFMLLYELYLDWRQGNARDGAIVRILVSLSVSDIIFSLAWFLTTWPSPSDLTYIRNQATCTFQGFILQLGYGSSPLFNVTLALFFLLRIRYRWTDSHLRRLEPWVQASIWTFALAAAIYPIPLGLYNNGYYVCWIESYPMDCLDSYRYGDEATCTRGDNAWIHALFFSVFPLWVCIFCALIFMGMIYTTVSQVEQRNTRYGEGSFNAAGGGESSKVSVVGKIRASLLRSSSLSAASTGLNISVGVEQAEVANMCTNNSSQQPPEGSGETIITPYSSSETMNTTPQHRQKSKRRNHQRSDMVATQAMWYIAAFFATYSLDFIASIFWYAKDWWWFWLDIFAYFFMPLQGFFNFLVFMRSRKMKSRLGTLTRKVLYCSWCCDNRSSISCMAKMQELLFCSSCCNVKDQTTNTDGGGGDKSNSANPPCPAPKPPPPFNNNNIADHHDPKTTRALFASPPIGETSQYTLSHP
jgi:hypothetical protein